MGKIFDLIMTIISIVCIAITFTCSIISICMGAAYMNILCDSQSYIKISSWLITYGSVNLAAIIFMLIVSGVSFIGKATISSNSWICITISLIVIALFNLVWNIVGSFTLFGNSMNCQITNNSLWSAMLAVIITEWVKLFLVTILIFYTGTK